MGARLTSVRFARKTFRDVPPFCTRGFLKPSIRALPARRPPPEAHFVPSSPPEIRRATPWHGGCVTLPHRDRHCVADHEKGSSCGPLSTWKRPCTPRSVTSFVSSMRRLARTTQFWVFSRVELLRLGERFNLIPMIVAERHKSFSYGAILPNRLFSGNHLYFLSCHVNYVFFGLHDCKIATSFQVVVTASHVGSRPNRENSLDEFERIRSMCSQVHVLRKSIHT
jgi:hypothetical protein